jgi:hypothetical protein
VKSRRIHQNPAVWGGILCLFISLPALPEAGHTYNGPDGKVEFHVTPSTGTLNDLRVVVNDTFAFFPSHYGGILSFELAGERLFSWENKHQCQVAQVGYGQDESWARFRWSYKGDSFEFDVGAKLKGKTLTLKFSTDASVRNVIQFGLDRSEETPDPKIIVLPYGHNVLYSSKVFISANLDPQQSNASTIETQNQLYSGTSAYYSQVASYGERTDGLRNNLEETIVLTVSPGIDDTFYVPASPVSAYKSDLTNKVVLDLWRESFLEDQQDIRSLAAMGLKDLFVIIHLWQKYGYDNGFPTTHPAGDTFGGEAALKEASSLCRQNGYSFSLHTNYVDFYPNSDDWNPADIALTPRRHWVKSWFNPFQGAQSFLLKPSLAVKYARMYEPAIHDTYGTTGSYLDVHSAVLPSYKVDFDTAVDDPGKQKATFRHYRDLFQYARDTHRGPVVGEGYGYSTAIWAGYIDAVEADPRSALDMANGLGGKDVPLLIDYKTRVLNKYFVPQGAGFLERFYPAAAGPASPDEAAEVEPIQPCLNPRSYSGDEMERYRATELAFASAGFLSNPFLNGFPEIEILREYCFLKHMQPYYLNAEPVETYYFFDGAFLTLNDILLAVLPSTPGDRVSAALLEHLSQVKVVYDNGFLLYVNRSQSKPLDVVEDGLSWVLPPNGFLGKKGTEFLAYTALINGEKAYYVFPAENPCRGNLNDYLFAPLDPSIEKVYNRSVFQSEYLHILTWRPHPENSGVAKYRVYQGEGNQRAFLGEVDGKTCRYLHRKVQKSGSYHYAVVAVNGEGREGEAAFISLK